jgi:hypothetical protein
MNEAADTIQAARELLSDPTRWGKGKTRPTPESYCLASAISRNCLGVTYNEYKAITDLVGQHVPGGMALTIYNDHPDTTHEDILNLLDKTLADLGAL